MNHSKRPSRQPLGSTRPSPAAQTVVWVQSESKCFSREVLVADISACNCGKAADKSYLLPRCATLCPLFTHAISGPHCQAGPECFQSQEGASYQQLYADLTLALASTAWRDPSWKKNHASRYFFARPQLRPCSLRRCRIGGGIHLGYCPSQF
jgi:hypothetical protein